MLKRFLFTAVAAIFMAIQFNIGSVNALEMNESIRTIPLNDNGEQLTLSLKQVKQGQKVFVDSCSYCHKGGATKTNPNVNLGLTALAGAYPARDNVEGIVDYLKNPTTYDGERDIYFNGLRADRRNKGLSFTTKELPIIGQLNDIELKFSAGEDNEVQLFPNPVKSRLNFATDLELEYVAILSLIGEQVMLERNPGQSIDVSVLPSGTYITYFMAVEGIVVKEFVKF